MDSSDSVPKATTSGSLAAALPSPPERSNSQSSIHKSSHIATHRQSFAENQRHPPPPSPRSQRHPSFTQQAIQDLLNHPPANRHANPRFQGRDWQDISLGELVSADDIRWVDMDTSVLLKNTTSNIVLIREDAQSKTALSTFDYNDLNAYLLVVVGLAAPDEENVTVYDEIVKKAQSQQPISLREIQTICRKEQLVTLSAESTLDKVMETFGSGIHSVLVTEQGSVTGILSQLRLVEFFWNEGVNFPAIERLYGVFLRDLGIGNQKIIAINADKSLSEALTLMNNEGLTSVAVVDNGLNVTGNISTADVRHLTNAASMPLLKDTCMHFISVILSERGVEHGRDSFPVFHVNPYSTLAHTVAKLVATRSHRMWVVESASPSPSAPATPLLQPSHPTFSSSTTSSGPSTSTGSLPTEETGSEGATPTIQVPPATATVASPIPSSGFSSSVPAASLPGAHLSGRLTGVVSLTDVLNLFARSSGLHPADPSEQRARRRRSSSSSVRPSIDGSRTSLDFRR